MGIEGGDTGPEIEQSHIDQAYPVPGPTDGQESFYRYITGALDVSLEGVGHQVSYDLNPAYTNHFSDYESPSAAD